MKEKKTILGRRRYKKNALYLIVFGRETRYNDLAKKDVLKENPPKDKDKEKKTTREKRTRIKKKDEKDDGKTRKTNRKMKKNQKPAWAEFPNND
jgi:hypothetical protein